MSFQWLFVDLNSYFASVEQQLNPRLRGKPIGVVPMLAETTCCIAASYEAKRFGVKTGTLVYEARKMCPGIQFVQARHKEYVEYHHRIVEAVESCLPVTAVASIDEMACRLTGRDQVESNAIVLAREVKQKILKVGDQLFCSVGLAPNRYLAKVASDMQKPDGLTLIKKEQLPDVLKKLSLRDFPGIGRNMEIRLFEKGVTTTEQLLSFDIKKLRDIWGGVWGERFYKWVRGEDLEIEFGENKSVGHSHVLPPELRNQAGAYAVGQKLLHKAGVRLRKLNSWTSRMYLSIRYVDRTKWRTEVKMLECQDALTLGEVFAKLWKQQPNLKTPLKVSVTLFDLISDKDRTFSFFDNPGRIRLSQAVDAINSKYGRDTVFFAGVQLAKVAAPTRIAFTNIPDLSQM